MDTGILFYTSTVTVLHDLGFVELDSRSQTGNENEIKFLEHILCA